MHDDGVIYPNGVHYLLQNFFSSLLKNLNCWWVLKVVSILSVHLNTQGMERVLHWTL